MPPMTAIDIELRNVTKRYGDGADVVKSVNLSIPIGQFVSILGPSGCGKTTTLNMMAGFEEPSAGEILIRGKSQRGVPPENRHVGLVFQNYALFPHMTVAENVSFGLRMQGKPRAEIERALASALGSVFMQGFETRYPKELSGGQQQRVALARAIAPGPSVLLLDEPLSNLDLKLREAMREELREIQRKLRMTFVYVTHDQEEAMTMSDHIVVMMNGHIVQQGSPSHIYTEPASSVVANFIGKTNILEVSSCRQDGALLHLGIAGTSLVLQASGDAASSASEVKKVSIRPESIKLVGGADAVAWGGTTLEGQIARISNMGAYSEVQVQVANQVSLKLSLATAELDGSTVGRRVTLFVAPGAVRPLKD